MFSFLNIKHKLNLEKFEIVKMKLFSVFIILFLISNDKHPILLSLQNCEIFISLSSELIM